MKPSKHITFTEADVTITRVGDDVTVHSYPCSKITPASKSRLENVQFSAKTHPMVLFTTDLAHVFTTFDYC